jgi:hypothetical protein
MSQKYSPKEWCYRFINPRILVEEALISRDHAELKDFSVYIFRGIIKAINVGSPTNRKNKENVFFDSNWDEIKLTKYKENVPEPIPQKPDNLQEMIDAAYRLGSDLDFVGIDLYDTTKGVVLGEMTMYPEEGHRNTPTACPVFNKWLAEQWIQIPMLHIRQYNNLFLLLFRQYRMVAVCRRSRIERSFKGRV